MGKVDPRFTDPIWSDLYRVRVPMLGSRSIEDIRMRGVVLSGNKDVDKDIENRLIVTYITIDKMVEHHRNNVPIRLCHAGDARKIYEAITPHVQRWMYHLETSVNTRNVPLEDLLAMEHFASVVYEHAKYYLIGSQIESAFLREFTEVMPVNAGNFFKPGTRAKFVGKTEDSVRVTEDGHFVIGEDDDEPPERTSYQDFFQERLMKMAMKGR